MRNAKSHCWSAIIVDDDPTMVAILESYVKQIPKFELIASYTNPRKALKEIAAGEDIDFLFLDIKMEISGLHIGQILRAKVKNLIFITAYKEFALEAFGVSAEHYLLKPVQFTKFLSAINDVIRNKYRQATIAEK